MSEKNLKCRERTSLGNTYSKQINFNLIFLSAATPAYFFTPPQAGHNFFFSELLRSIVQKRKADELNAAMKAKSVPKKARKPAYHATSYHKVEPEYKRPKLSEQNVKISDPNENDDPKILSSTSHENSQDSVINVDKDDSPPAPQSTTLNAHPNSSAFYPYDPLHFFIDLRVSAGQVKKEAYLHQALKNNILLDSYASNNPIIAKNRIGSAFKVPGSLEANNNNFSAINLVANQHQSAEQKNYSKIFPRSDNGNESPSEDTEDIDVQIYECDTKRESIKRND
jgi:hypothetical protein